MKRLVPPTRWRLDTWILAIGLLAFLIVITLPACGAGAKACAVVDVAHSSCSVVRYLAPDGSVEELTATDLEQVAAAKRAAKGATPQPTGSAGGR